MTLDQQGVAWLIMSQVAHNDIVQIMAAALGVAWMGMALWDMWLESKEKK